MSLIINPFIILMNLFEWLGTLSMQASSIRINDRHGGALNIWKIVTIGSGLLVSFLFMMVIISMFIG